MTTLADLVPGEQFLFACEVTALDQVAGMSLALYGPGRVQAASSVISPAGVMSGQLAAPADQIPVTVVTGFAPVAIGDIMQNSVTGETMVARWAQIGTDGTVTWSSAVDHQVIYTAAGWTNIAHVDGL